MMRKLDPVRLGVLSQLSMVTKDHALRRGLFGIVIVPFDYSGRGVVTTH
jgi:hypothetical protein